VRLKFPQLEIEIEIDMKVERAASGAVGKVAQWDDAATPLAH
jgi:hypothetical protein